MDNNGVSTFILKLWKLVCSEDTNHLICWSSNGESFRIKDQARFAKEVLPLYFKHNNMASFIRQLNMYGFRKVSNIDHGGLKNDDDDIEFFHQFFSKKNEDQLQFIKRKMSIPKTGLITALTKADDVNEILSDVESMKGRQETVDTMLNNMKRENEALWREIAILRQKHMKQQQIVEKLLHFLATIVRNQVVSSTGSIKRKTPLMIDSSSNRKKILKTNKDGVCIPPSPGASGPIISDITDIGDNDLSLQPVNSNATSQLIQHSLPSSPQQTIPQISILSTDTNVHGDEDSNNLIEYNTENEPNNELITDQLLDFDIRSNQLDSDLTTDQLLSDHIGNSTLNITQPTIDESLLAISKPDKQQMVSNELIIPNQATSASNNLPILTSDYLTLNEHVDGMDAELNWLQDQLYGGNLNIDTGALFGIFSNDDQFSNFQIDDLANLTSGTNTTMSKAITGGPNTMTENEQSDVGEDSTALFNDFDLNNIVSDNKDILSADDLDLDPSTFA